MISEDSLRRYRVRQIVHPYQAAPRVPEKPGPRTESQCFRVLLDPGPYPLARGAELSQEEVVYGVALGGFNPGTRIWDPHANATCTVVETGDRLWLEPASRRISRLIRKAQADDLESW